MSSLRSASLTACFGASAALLFTAPPATADSVETAGEILRVVLPVAAGGISLLKQDHDGVLHLALSEGASLGLSFLLQKAIESRRPDGSDLHSFPSDSAAMAFSAAAYLERRYGWDYGLPAYAVAGFVGYSRVDSDRHHWHDVAAGALIGWAASRLITSPYRDGVQLSIASGYADTPLGAQLRMTW